MFKRLLVLIAIITFSIGCTMWNKPVSGWKGATGGEQIEQLFWKDVQAKNWQEVDRHLADTFTATGPAGPLDRVSFMNSLQQSGISEVSLSDCKVQTNGADLVVACTVHARSAQAPAAAFSSLSVWQQLKKGWVLVAHAQSPLASPTQVTEK